MAKNNNHNKFETTVLKKSSLPKNDTVTITECLKKDKCYKLTFLYNGKANKGIKKFTVTFGGKLLITSSLKDKKKQVVKFGNCRK